MAAWKGQVAQLAQGKAGMDHEGACVRQSACCLQQAQPSLKAWAFGSSQSLVSSILLMLHKGPKLLKEAQDQTVRHELIRFNARNKLANHRLRSPLRRSEGASLSGVAEQGFAQLCSIHIQWQGRKHADSSPHSLGTPPGHSSVRECCRPWAGRWGWCW